MFRFSIDFCNAYSVLDTCRHFQIPNGKVLYDRRGEPPASDSNWTVGTVAFFYCNSGYSRNGTYYRICQTYGDWNSQNPACNWSKLYDFWVSLWIVLYRSIVTFKHINIHNHPKIVFTLDLNIILTIQTKHVQRTLCSWQPFKGINHNYPKIKLILDTQFQKQASIWIFLQ